MQGDVLVEIDAQPLVAALAQAEAAKRGTRRC